VDDALQNGARQITLAATAAAASGSSGGAMKE
jgi:hypothetical protein